MARELVEIAPGRRNCDGRVGMFAAVGSMLSPARLFPRTQRIAPRYGPINLRAADRRRRRRKAHSPSSVKLFSGTAPHGTGPQPSTMGGIVPDAGEATSESKSASGVPAGTSGEAPSSVVGASVGAGSIAGEFVLAGVTRRLATDLNSTAQPLLTSA
jgi:hypothetical protein